MKTFESNNRDRVRFGITGLGGYAKTVCQFLMSAEGEGESDLAEDGVEGLDGTVGGGGGGGGGGGVGIRLSAVCDPDLGRHAEVVSELRERGVAIFDDYAKMIEASEELGLEVVWLPVPIGLHRPFAEMALSAGLSVITEKPAAGCVEDVDAMAAAERAAFGTNDGGGVLVAYQMIYNPTTRAIKSRLLDGAIGEIERGSVYGCWPRDDAYYGRAAWAGAMRSGQTWVLDGPAANAMSHHLMLTLFFMGETLGEAVTPLEMEAEAYRTRPIENNDTLAMRMIVGGGGGGGGGDGGGGQVEVGAVGGGGRRVMGLFTHACDKDTGPVITIEGSAGRLVWRTGAEAVMSDLAGHEIERWALDSGAVGLREEAFAVARLAREGIGSAETGTGSGAIALATLSVARAPVVAINGAAEATPVYDLPAGAYSVNSDSGLRMIPGILELFERCAASGELPHETGMCDWTKPGGRKDLRGYARFGGPAGLD